MNIVIIYPYYQTEEEPGHSLIYDWTQYLAKQGHQVSVIAGESGYMRYKKPHLPWYKRIKRQERVGEVLVIRTYTHMSPSRNYMHRLFSMLSFSCSCLLGVWNVPSKTVILGSSPPIMPLYLIGLFCAIRRIPFVLEIRDLWPESAVQMGIVRSPWIIRPIQWLTNCLYKKSAHLITLTEGIKTHLHQAQQIPMSHMTTISHGVNIQHFYQDAASALPIRNQPLYQGKQIVLYFGALGKANHIDVILKAARHLESHPNICFLLIGDGSERAHIKATLEASPAANVILHDPAPKTEARAYINAADICLLTLLDIPVFHEAIPTKLFEYMACGKPVIAGVRGTLKATIEQYAVGWTFEPDDASTLAAQICLLLADPTLRARMGEQGVQTIRAQHTNDIMQQAVEAVLVKAAAEICLPTPSSI